MVEMIIVIIVIIFLLWLIANIIIARYFFTVMLKRSSDWYFKTGHKMVSSAPKDAKTLEKKEIAKQQAESGELFWDSCNPETLEIKSKFGLNLVASILKVNPDSKRWGLFVHGYRSNGKMDTSYISKKVIEENNFNALIPDLRAHGRSDGKYIGLGYPETEDVHLWINEILKIEPEAEILLFGDSMGAATIMMSLKNNIPKNVKAVVVDCGFTSIVDELNHLINDILKLPKIFPIVGFFNVFYSNKFGLKMKEASPINALKRSRIPIQFIHGSADIFIPTEMSKRNLASSNSSIKDLLIVNDAPHFASHFYDPELYFETIDKFIDETFD